MPARPRRSAARRPQAARRPPVRRDVGHLGVAGPGVRSRHRPVRAAPCTSIVRTLGRGQSWMACPPPRCSSASPGSAAPPVWGSGSRRPSSVSCSATACGDHRRRRAVDPGRRRRARILSLAIAGGHRCSRSPRGARRAAAASNPPSCSAGRSAAAPWTALEKVTIGSVINPDDPDRHPGRGRGRH